MKLCTYLNTFVTYIIICNHTLHVFGECRHAEEGLMRCHTVSKESCMTPLPAHKMSNGFQLFSFFVGAGIRYFRTEIGPRGGEQPAGAAAAAAATVSSEAFHTVEMSPVTRAYHPRWSHSHQPRLGS